MSDKAYEDLKDHLLDEAEWARALVRQFLKSQALSAGRDSSLETLSRGFSVGPEEAKRLLEIPPQEPRALGEADLIRQRIYHRLELSEAEGRLFPLSKLKARFNLDELHYALLVLALLSETDAELRRLFTFVWNDFSKKSPSIEFLLGLLQPSFLGRIDNAHAFFLSSPLLRDGLIQMFRTESESPFLAQEVRLSPSVVSFCLGGHELDPLLQAAAELTKKPNPPIRYISSPKLAAPLFQSLTKLESKPELPIALIGPSGVGKSTLVGDALKKSLTVHVASLLHPVALGEKRISALKRDAHLLELPLVLDLSHLEDRPEHTPLLRSLADFIQSHRFGAVIMAHEASSPLMKHLSHVLIYHIDLPTKSQRKQIWKEALKLYELEHDDRLLEAVGRYPLSGGSIIRAAKASTTLLSTQGRMTSGQRQQGFIEACQREMATRLSGIASRIVTSLTWDDLVLPEAERETLQEVVAYVRNHDKVYKSWGFDRIVPYGRGLSVLFAGPPGTGKTMAAGIIGGELGMDVFRADLSKLVSKYIGETEKNLGRIFDEAAKTNSILLFDEADSLFAKRTGVKSSVDRYANLEVNYLLQRIEDFEGVTILTTNLEGAIDEAFQRRIKFRVRFPAPDEATREKLWKKMLPEDAPLEENIDFEGIGYDYELSGGHIKTAILRAAFSAANQGETIRETDLRRAARLECEKLGKIVRVPDDNHF